MADLTLADAKEHGHHLLERVALEVKQHEKELGLGGGQHARVPGSRLALTHLLSPQITAFPLSGSFIRQSLSDKIR